MRVYVHIREILEIFQDCACLPEKETIGLWKRRNWKGKQTPKQTHGNPVAVSGREKNGLNTKKKQSKPNKP